MGNYNTSLQTAYIKPKTDDWCIDRLKYWKEDIEKKPTVKMYIEHNEISVSQNKVILPLHYTKNQPAADLKLYIYEDGIFRFRVWNSENTQQFSVDYVMNFADNLQPFIIKNHLKIAKEHEYCQLDIKGTENHKEVSYTIFISLNETEPFLIKIILNGQVVLQINQQNYFKHSKHPSVDFRFNTPYLYGIPLRWGHFLLENTKQGKPYKLQNIDIYCQKNGTRESVYGSVPVIIAPGHQGNHNVGIFWNNPSKTYVDVHKEQNSVTTFWQSESGDIDVFISISTSIELLNKKNNKILGIQPLPQYFSLGYCQSRYAYKSQEEAQDVENKFNQYKIPYDILVLDINHTDKYKYFTWDYKAFPQPKQLQENLSQNGRKLMTIQNPHAKMAEDYPLYTQARAKDVLVKDCNNHIFIGQNWPGKSVWIDFINPEGQKLWSQQYYYENYKDSTPNLYAWNDMNEPTVFRQENNTFPKDNILKFNNNTHQLRQISFDYVQNIYGTCMIKATYQGLIERNQTQNDRPFVLGRGFYAGVQKYGIVWTGDYSSTWEYLKTTIHQLLSMSVCGISLCGADIPGHESDCTPELFRRMFQTGIFFPNFRGHSSKNCQRKEPWVLGDEVLSNVRDQILLRYKLLHYIYTQQYLTMTEGSPLMKPIWFKFQFNEEAFKDQENFLFGDNILVIPKIYLSSNYYRVEDYWLQYRLYHLHTLEEATQSGQQEFNQNYIGAYYIGGSITALSLINGEEKSSIETKKKPLELIICLDKNYQANGCLYIDDGSTFDYKQFYFKQNTLSIEFLHKNFEDQVLDSLVILGSKEKYSSCVCEDSLHGTKNYQVITNDENQIRVKVMNLKLEENLNIKLT